MIRSLRIGLAAGFVVWGCGGGARAAPSAWGLGIGYLRPLSPEVSSSYGGGVSFHAMGEAPVSRSIRVAAELGYRRSSAPLPHPDFIDDAKGTLHAFPVDLVARFAIPAKGAYSPHLGAGLELLWLKEHFAYTTVATGSERDPAARFGIGPIVIAGVDRIRFPRLRLEITASIVPLRRAVSIGDAEYPAERIIDGSYGARVLWRFP